MTRPLPRRLIAIAAVSGFVLGLIYVWSVPPGLPYDEPSHWNTVRFYADHSRVPVLGDPGVTYEAQMGPVAYAAAAVVVKVARAVGTSPRTTFDAIRVLGLIEFAVAVAGIGALLRRLPMRQTAAVAALGAFALNPMLLTMSASVQNDTLALALGVWALYFAVRFLAVVPDALCAIVVGVVSGTAILTKLTAWLLIPVIVAWLIWRHRGEAWSSVLVFVASASAVCAWWFVRNVALYGDLTAAGAVRRTGVSFSAGHIRSVGDAAHLAQEAVTYLWLPTEYLRNTISADASVKVAVAVVTAVFLIGGVLVGRRRARGHAEVPELVLLAVAAFLSIASWLVTYVAYQAVAPRVAYLALPVWLIAVAWTLDFVAPTVAVVATLVLLLGLNGWTLHAIGHAHTRGAPFLIRFPDSN